jgi:hypothetical protein
MPPKTYLTAAWRDFDPAFDNRRNGEAGWH